MKEIKKSIKEKYLDLGIKTIFKKSIPGIKFIKDDADYFKDNFEIDFSFEKYDDETLLFNMKLDKIPDNYFLIDALNYAFHYAKEKGYKFINVPLYYDLGNDNENFAGIYIMGEIFADLDSKETIDINPFVFKKVEIEHFYKHLNELSNCLILFHNKVNKILDFNEYIFTGKRIFSTTFLFGVNINYYGFNPTFLIKGFNLKNNKLKFEVEIPKERWSNYENKFEEEIDLLNVDVDSIDKIFSKIDNNLKISSLFNFNKTIFTLLNTNSTFEISNDVSEEIFNKAIMSNSYHSILSECIKLHKQNYIKTTDLIPCGVSHSIFKFLSGYILCVEANIYSFEVKRYNYTYCDDVVEVKQTLLSKATELINHRINFYDINKKLENIK